MHRVLRVILLAVILAGLTRIGLARVRVDFDTARAYDLIANLSSSEFGGRLCGEKGNEAALNLIAELYADCHLAPLPGLTSYFQRFETDVPILHATPVLEVLKGEKIVRSFLHRVDFREITAGDAGSGNITGHFTAAPQIEAIPSGEGRLVLLADEFHNVGDDRALLALGVRALIVQKPEDMARSKSVFLSPGKSGGRIVKVLVTPGVMEELIDFSRQGCQIHLEVDYSVVRVKTANIAGLIQGTNGDTEGILVLSAHLDHVGRDPSGLLFAGALDNASGTAVMLTLMESMAGLEIRPKKTVIFIGFNAEEVGLQGSAHLVERWPFPRTKPVEVLNLDMLGGKESHDLTCLIDPAALERLEKHEFIGRLRMIADETKIPVVIEASSASDHASFTRIGLPALTLMFPGEGAVAHTAADTVTSIDPGCLAAAGKMVAGFVTENAYEWMGE